MGATFSFGGEPGMQVHPLLPSLKIDPSEPIIAAFSLTLDGAADMAISIIFDVFSS
jgi:hypothetical protein